MIKLIETAKERMSAWVTGGNAMDVDGKIESARLGVATLGVATYTITLSDMVALFTIIYLIIQMIVLLPRAVESIRCLARFFRKKNQQD